MRAYTTSASATKRAAARQGRAGGALRRERAAVARDRRAEQGLILELERAVVEYFVKVGDSAVVERNKTRGNKISTIPMLHVFSSCR